LKTIKCITKIIKRENLFLSLAKTSDNTGSDGGVMCKIKNRKNEVSGAVLDLFHN
jgi:hypothetical protein